MYNLTYMINSPMEQYILFPVVSFNLTITNVIFYLLVATAVTLLLSGLATGTLNKDQGRIVATNYQLVSESLFRTILNMLENFVGPKYAIFLPLFYSLFHIILFSNLFGLLPYSSTPTVEIIMTLSLAFTVAMGLLLLGFLTHKLYLLAIFLPGGTPLVLIPVMVVLEIIAYLSRTVSLGLRLAIN